MSLSEKLIVAAKNGNSREVRKLLGRGAMFTKDQFGNTALHEAAWNGNKDIVKALLGGFCFVDSINHTGFTPLHLASQNGHAKVTKILLKWRADPCLLNQHGETALHLVAKYNHPTVISAFSAFKIPMDIRGKDGNTALHIAAKLGNIEVMRALLHHGADPHMANVHGIRPLDFAETGKYRDCTKLLQSMSLKPKSKSTLTLPTAVQRSSTYSSTSTDIAAAKIRMMKAMGVSKSKQRGHSTKDKKQKRGGYYSEDEVSYYQVDSSPPPLPHPRFSASQEVPDGFTYGAVGGGDHSLSPLCHSFSSASSQQSKTASIDQLLNDIEREYCGSGYNSTPSDKDKGLIKPYAEIYQFHMPRPTELGHVRSQKHVGALPTDAKSCLLSTQEGRVTKKNYDSLQPPTSPRDIDESLEPSSASTPKTNSAGFANSIQPLSPDQVFIGDKSERYMHALRGARLRYGNERPSSLMKSSGSPSKSPSKSRKLPSRSPGRERRKSDKLKPEDTDTYVYMAPLTDFADATDFRSHLICGPMEKSVGQEESESADLHEASCELSSSSGSENGNKNSKKAIICNHPIHTLTRHEPDSSRVPAKGILSQSSVNEDDKSLLEHYLQEELETMRQAFQIRLAQLEKRYKKQLIVEQQRNVAQHHIQDRRVTEHAQPSSAGLRRRSGPHSGRHSYSSKRRNSWHSYITSEQELDKLALPDEPRSESSLGIDSDHYATEESDIEMEPGEDESANKKMEEQSKKEDSSFSKAAYLNELPESTRGELDQQLEEPMYAKPRKHNEGLKGGSRSWREGSQENERKNIPQLQHVNEDLNREEDGPPIDDEAKRLIQKKIEEYRGKMTQYFQEKSEAQICTIEEKYLKQMDEMKKKYDRKASEKLSHLTDRIKDLENLLDVQTLV